MFFLFFMVPTYLPTYLLTFRVCVSVSMCHGLSAGDDACCLHLASDFLDTHLPAEVVT